MDSGEIRTVIGELYAFKPKNITSGLEQLLASGEVVCVSENFPRLYCLDPKPVKPAARPAPAAPAKVATKPPAPPAGKTAGAAKRAKPDAPNAKPSRNTAPRKVKREQIVADWRAGMHVRDIASKHGITEQGAYYYRPKDLPKRERRKADARAPAPSPTTTDLSPNPPPAPGAASLGITYPVPPRPVAFPTDPADLAVRLAGQLLAEWPRDLAAMSPRLSDYVAAALALRKKAA